MRIITIIVILYKHQKVIIKFMCNKNHCHGWFDPSFLITISVLPSFRGKKFLPLSNYEDGNTHKRKKRYLALQSQIFFCLTFAKKLEVNTCNLCSKSKPNVDPTKSYFVFRGQRPDNLQCCLRYLML